MIVANLMLRFVVELAGLAGLAVWGAGATSNGVGQVLLAIAAPLVAAGVWGTWSAPRAPRRLPGTGLLAVELAVLAMAVAALADAGHPVAAVVLGVVALANGAFLRRADAARSSQPPGSDADSGADAAAGGSGTLR
ncbi:MAG TPA: YrdB family protein [Solirubrobacteraceae bacterium]